jgi:hypothetical protein
LINGRPGRWEENMLRVTAAMKSKHTKTLQHEEYKVSRSFKMQVKLRKIFTKVLYSPLLKTYKITNIPLRRFHVMHPVVFRS